MTPDSTPATTADMAVSLRRIAANLSGVALELTRMVEYIELSRDAIPVAAGRHRRKAHPKRMILVDETVLHEREKLWLRYFGLKVGEVSAHPYHRVRGACVPTSKAFFAQKMGINTREFARWFAAKDGVTAGSYADESVRRALHEEIARMLARAGNAELPTPHGVTSDNPIDLALNRTETQGRG